MDKISLSKSNYSEWVIRNSLYWLSSVTDWQLSDSDSFWTISLKDNNDQVVSQLHRLLNDYKLREILAQKTQRITDSIAVNVLTSIDNRLKLQ
ncbi:His-Xaa-Ser system protein HxsD [Rheinheimera muenzenbergensis]|uniref:His-Xaa-Ser system protein HxsD n=1 Tax=Rheinheimera muenzenbergensis TaxID=1193628 RepID=A0ABU8CAJ8_9GAMM